MILLIIWQIIFIVQVVFSYGTAYRMAKSGGDSGVSLFGWLWLMQLASLIPGLGIFLWFKFRYEETYTSIKNHDRYIKCADCGKKYDDSEFPSCPDCRSKNRKL